MYSKKQFKVIIGGGGTGGHVFPSIAIANALKEQNNEIDILFIGANDKIEMQKVPEAGYKIRGLWISGLHRKFTLKNLLFPFKLTVSLIKSYFIIKEYKPDVIVGVGGFASGPILYLASLMKIPTLIQEQNSYAGVTNKILAKKVNKICVAYDEMNKFFPKEKIIVTGNPVRKDILDVHLKKHEGYEYFGLSKNKKTVLVVGGSLGARTINKSIKTHLMDFVNQNIQLIWQTGKHFYFEASEATVKYIDTIKVYDFISRMDLAYAAADIIVSRAGACSISELCLVKKPAILVPSPNVAEDHQTKNAMALVQNNAAIMIKDIEAKEKIVSTAIALLSDMKLQKTLSENIGKMAKHDSAQTIAKEIIQLFEH